MSSLQLRLLPPGRVSLTEVEGGEFSRVSVTVRFIRRFGFYLLTLYLPSFLLIVIAYCTLFFNVSDFNSRIVVALTSLLVLSSLYTSVSPSLRSSCSPRSTPR